MSPQLGPSSGAVLTQGSSSTPITEHGLERRLAWPEKTHASAPDAFSSSGTILSNDGQFQGLNDGRSGSGPIVPEPTTGELVNVLPAYMA